MYKGYSDVELVALLKQHDRGAFEEIYLRHWSSMYLAAYNILEDHDASMDIVQDLFIWIWQKRVELTIITLKSYLHSAVKHKVANVLRNLKVRKSFIESQGITEPSFNNVSSELEVRELRLILSEFMKDLPERCREVFDLSRNQHLSNKEIANKLGISEKAVEKQMTIALKRLRISLMRSVIAFISIF